MNMSDEFQKYKKLVVHSYRIKLAAGPISNNLAVPTPAKLRDECLKIYSLRYKKETDSRTLEDFFGNPDKHGDYRSIIYSFKVSRFKPLAQFLNDINREPDTRIIELLAWLIDYEARPFRFDTFVDPDEDKPNPEQLQIPASTTEPIQPQTPEQSEGPATVPENEHTPEPKEPVTPPFPPTLTWKGWISKHEKKTAFALVLFGLIVILFVKMQPRKQCMYWSEDHYEAVDCEQPIFGVKSIALDTLKLNHFKKITKPDTMTTYSVGKVWYVDTGKETPECFTIDGHHPLYPDKNLKPLSLHILRKYFGTSLTDDIKQ